MKLEGSFRYSIEQRIIVAEALAVDPEHSDCRFVEHMVGEWLISGEDELKGELARNARIADLASKLLDELQPYEFDLDEHYLDDGGPATLEGHLISLLNWIEKVADENALPKGRRPQIPAKLSTRLIEFWENSGRRVGRSTKTDEQTDEQSATGPLVRFLLAEPPRVFRRLRILRERSHDKQAFEEIFI